MGLAVREAARAVGKTHPNPPVGCVIVREGVIVGLGHTQPPPGPHAEVMALREAGAAARGAALYVSLEPCSHHGRTPPCAGAIVRAGVSRVVAALRDPNPAASNGFATLAAAGIATDVVDPDGRAADRLAAFLHWARTGLPYVVLKSAMTLDGKTASASGASRWITGPVARAYTHRLRNRLGAVMVGIGTAMADDPMLTARRTYSEQSVAAQPARIVVDAALRLPLSSRLVTSARAAPLIIVCGSSADDGRERALRALGAQVLRVAERDGKPDFAILQAELGKRGITGILLEGGGELAFSALEAGCVNEVLYFIAPTLMGGRDAHTPLDGKGFPSPEAGIRVRGMTVRRCGSDWVARGRILESGS
jgi:diaminohydroxyphosphoribosylaminopyrimidine deaminase/5-amino-6-(5-phosphoribosylamino)uracil reductase